MIGLMYLGAVALYLTLMFFVVRWAWRKGRADGGSRIKASGFATIGFLAVYLPVFWNWIPVVLTHRSLCNTDAGFTAYVTPEQWVAQNRDQFAQLVGVDLEALILPREHLASGYSRYKFFGGLLATEERSKVWNAWGIQFYRGERLVVDVRTGNALTRSVGYSAGSREDIRLWLPQLGCFRSDAEQPSTQENLFTSKLKEEIK
jgi:hypothetical protein